MFEFHKGEIILVEKQLHVAKLKYSEKKNVYYLNSVWVDPSQRGKGIAQKLVKSLIEKAKENNFKIVPICSYAVEYFKQNPDKSYILENANSKR